METFQIRYFKSVAETQNIQQSSKKLNLSPSALSKAISRLEEELEVELFQKVGRNIQLTSAGKKLQKEAAKLLAVEKDIYLQFKQNFEDQSIKLVGSEMVLSHWGSQIIQRLTPQFSNMSYQLESIENEKVLEMVNNYSADIGVFCSQEKLSGEFYHELGQTTFKSFVSSQHSLYSSININIDEVLNYSFVVAERGLYGDTNSGHANDGWNDKQVQRKKLMRTNSLKTLEKLTLDGLAIAYLPEYLGNELNLKSLAINGCPFVCHQYIYAFRSKYGLNEMWKILSDL